MRRSEFFIKTKKNVPKDELSLNAKLLMRAGFVEKLMSGVYSYLPLGLITLRKIEDIVRNEMNRIGGMEILMPMLHPKSIWEKSGGWDNIDVLFKIKSRRGKYYALGQSEEEVVAELMKNYIKTYKDLPLAVYQINWKFRDELRAKSGLMRGIEFYMKDMYSFHRDQKDFEVFYDKVKKAYIKIFKELGLNAKASEASGGAFSEKISYEFMVLTDAGEDEILYCDLCDFCVNKQITKNKKGDRCPRCGKGKLNSAVASEVGNVFDLGEKYSKDFGIKFIDKDGKMKYAVMGCYGIGISRLMGVIVEKFHDEDGIIWPKKVAPYLVYLIELDNNKVGSKVKSAADKFYNDLKKYGVSALYDDREAGAGEKFVDADLIGLPFRAVVSDKTKGKIEIKERRKRNKIILSPKESIKFLLDQTNKIK